MHCAISIARCRIAVLERNGATMERNAEAAGLQEAAWRLMKRRALPGSSVLGRRAAAIIQGWRHQGRVRVAESCAASRQPTSISRRVAQS